jgi:hypothetical protein
MTVQELADLINSLAPGMALHVPEHNIQSLTGSAAGWRGQTIIEELHEKVIGSAVGTVETETNPITGDVTFHKTHV